MDLALEEVELELGDDVDLFVSTSNDNKTHNNNDSDNWPLRQDREDARSRGHRISHASECLWMPRDASQCLSVPLNASQCMAYMSKMRQTPCPTQGVTPAGIEALPAKKRVELLCEFVRTAPRSKT